MKKLISAIFISAITVAASISNVFASGFSDASLNTTLEGQLKVIYRDNNLPSTSNRNTLLHSAATPLIMRSGRLLVPLEVLNNLPNIEASYSSDTKEVVVKVVNRFGVVSNTYTQYVQDFIIYENGLNCYTGDVRSDYLNGEPYISIRKVEAEQGSIGIQEKLEANEFMFITINHV